MAEEPDPDPLITMIQEASKEAANFAYRKGRRDAVEQIIASWNDDRIQSIDPFERLLMVRDEYVKDDREHNIKGYGDG